MSKTNKLQKYLPKEPPETVSVSIRGIPKELWAKIEVLKDKHGTSMNSIILAILAAAVDYDGNH